MLTSQFSRTIVFPRFSGHLLITLRRLTCPDIPNQEKHGSILLSFKIKAVELSLREDVKSKDVALALDIHPFMLSRWRKEHKDGKFTQTPRYKGDRDIMSKLPTKKELTDIQKLKKRMSV